MRFLFVLLLLTITPSVLAQQSTEFQEAVAAFDSEDYEASKKLFQTIYDGNKEPGSAYYLGRIALKEGASDKAIKWLEEAVEQNDKSPDYHYWLSEAYFGRINDVGMMKKAGLAKKGRKAAEQTVELDPTHRDARTSLIYFYTQAPKIAGGSKEKAKEQANILLSHHPKRGRMMLAMVYSSEEEHEKADAEYTALINEFANDADIHYSAGMHFQRRENYREALRIFQKATSIDPDQLNALYQIGRTVVFADDQHDVGIEALQLYVEKDLPENVPSHASAWWRMGMIYELASRPDEARSAFESALKLDPDHKEAKQALKEL